MAAFHEQLSPDLIDFIRHQHVFFVASAASEGRINLSPKGMDTFRAFGPRSVGYLDLTGSGNETAAHILHDGRITLMFCSFEETPLILRIYGRGKVIRPRDSQWGTVVASFNPIAGQRQIILIDIESVQTSCGFAVPRMELVKERPTLVDWADKKGPDGIREYWAGKNQKSIDGLPTHLI